MRRFLVVTFCLTMTVGLFAQKMDRAKMLMLQERTLEVMGENAAAGEGFAIDRGAYFPGASTEKLCRELAPMYMKKCNFKDLWGNPFVYFSDGQNYLWISTGSDGLLDHPVAKYVEAAFSSVDSPVLGATTFFDADTVLANGKFVRFPDGKQKRRWSRDKQIRTHRVPSQSDLDALWGARGGPKKQPVARTEPIGKKLDALPRGTMDIGLPLSPLSGALGAKRGETLPGDMTWATANVAIGPQPDRVDLEALKDMGFSVIINLQGANEEGAAQVRMAAERLGYFYYTLPTTAEELNWQHVARFQDLLRKRNGRKTIIHCSSGNRAAGMWALHRAADLSGLEAVQEAIYMGMHEKGRIIKKVRTLLGVGSGQLIKK